MDKREQAIAELMAGWDKLISDGDMTTKEMVESLIDQMSGYQDMSADELTDDLAELMGWNPSAITDDQLDAWRDLVNEAATRYMYK